MPDENPFSRSAQILAWRLKPRALPANRGWTDSQLPEKGACYLVADGLASTSFESRLYKPWINALKPILRTSDSDCITCGFSYLQPRHHYLGHHTNISLLESSKRLFFPYAPVRGQTITYLAFSLASPLIALGLQDILLRRRTLVMRGIARAVILVQPALALSNLAMAAYEGPSVEPIEVPNPVAEVMNEAETIQTAVVKALGDIVDQGIHVLMPYWPRDAFIDYPQALLDDLRDAGVKRVPLDMTFPSSPDPFQQHCNVRHHPAMLEALEALLWSN